MNYRFHLIVFSIVLCAPFFPGDLYASTTQNFAFKYKWNGQIFPYRVSAADWPTAFERSAEACFNHFKQGRRVAEEVGVSIIDSCANPIETKIE